MSVKEQVRRRLAAGVAGVVLGIALVVGVGPVAADGDPSEPHDVNVGKDATGMASDTHITITEVVTPPVVSNDTTAAPVQPTPVVADPDDHRD